MPDPNLPKVYYARPGGGEPKVLTPCSRENLEALLRIGWKTETPYVVIDGKTVGKLIETVWNN